MIATSHRKSNPNHARNPNRPETAPKVVDRRPPGPAGKGQDAISDLTRTQSTAVTVRNPLPDRVAFDQRKDAA
jgi:hypothetical protein